MYDRDGKLVRELHASALKKVSGMWGARHVEMKSVEEKTRTVLTIDEAKFNQHLDEKLFAPDNLDSAPEIKPGHESRYFVKTPDHSTMDGRPDACREASGICDPILQSEDH